MTSDKGPGVGVVVRLGVLTLGIVALVALAVKLGSRQNAVTAPHASASASSRPAAPGGPRGTVTVLVYDDGAPFVGRPVVFHDVDGAVLSEGKTGGDGKASGEITAGGMITVAYGTSLKELVTVTGLELGEQIIVGETEDEGERAEVKGRALVRLPGARAGATRYAVSLGVGSTEPPDLATPLAMPVLKRFVRSDGKFPVLAHAVGSSAQPVAFSLGWGEVREARDGGATKGGSDAGADGSTDVRAPEIPVRMPPWSDAFRSVALRLVDVPEGITAARADLAIASGEVDRFDFPSRNATPPDGGTIPPLPEGAEIVFRIPPGLGDEVTYELEVTHATGVRSLVRRRVHAIGAEVRLPLRELHLPAPSDVTVTKTADDARPEVAFKVDGDARKADAAVVRVSWPATREHVWTVLAAPSAATKIRLPLLPPSLAALRPGKEELAVSAALVEASFFPTYRSLREKGLARLSELEDGENDVTVRATIRGPNLSF